MTKTEIMSTLKALDAAPRKSFGQNFLHDQNMAAWIVNCLELQPDDQVVEIGPGLGALTELIVSQGLSATLLEKDRKFVSYLLEKFKNNSVQVILGDALDCNIPLFFPLSPVKLVGNLPYYVSSQLLLRFLERPCPFKRAVFTIQRELADRLAAQPGTKEYGSLSVWVQAGWEISKPKILPPNLFYPQPEVESAAIVMTPHRNHVAFSPALFKNIVRTAFSERRKQLRKNLLKIVSSEQLDDALYQTGISGTQRPEEISCKNWINLSNCLIPKELQYSNQDELLQIVDEFDRPIGGRDRATIHRNQQLHRAVHVMICNQKNELFLQRRSYHKDQFPGCWDSSASGHVDVDESYDDCAVRELWEELGIKTSLERFGYLNASEKTGFEFIQIYKGHTDETPKLNAWEIEGGAFFPIETIKDWIARHPEDFAPGFLECWRVLRRGRN
jgi:16S rRNA (adenine1518-N6/adenine1519-N6)-dimethyltransferase